jgi:hypothetical protein
MYFESSDPDARDLTVRHQTGGRGGQFQRAHAVFEARNFICAHIKRDDQASRRLVQYLSMQSHRLLVLVRDAESGRLLIKPPEDQRWLYREKNGLGRASKNEWRVIRSIGPQFFEEMDKFREWHFSFKEYYDVYLWDLAAGEPFPVIFNTVQEVSFRPSICWLRLTRVQMLFKALRCRKGTDMYNLAAPVIKCLYTDKETHRVRDIKPGDGNESIYDCIHHERTQFYYGSLEMDGVTHKRTMEANAFPKHLWYNDADALEDEILFPEERDGKLDPLAVGKVEPIRIWEDEGFSFKKFVEGWDSDYSDVEGGDDDEGEGEDEDEDAMDVNSQDELPQSLDEDGNPAEAPPGQRPYV